MCVLKWSVGCDVWPSAHYDCIYIYFRPFNNPYLLFIRLYLSVLAAAVHSLCLSHIYNANIYTDVSMA